MKHQSAPLWVVRERSMSVSTPTFVDEARTCSRFPIEQRREALHSHRAPNIATVSPSPFISQRRARDSSSFGPLHTAPNNQASCQYFSSRRGRGRRRRRLPCDGEPMATSIRLACICPHLSIMRDVPPPLHRCSYYLFRTGRRRILSVVASGDSDLCSPKPT